MNESTITDRHEHKIMSIHPFIYSFISSHDGEPRVQISVKRSWTGILIMKKVLRMQIGKWDMCGLCLWSVCEMLVECVCVWYLLDWAVRASIGCVYKPKPIPERAASVNLYTVSGFRPSTAYDPAGRKVTWVCER